MRAVLPVATTLALAWSLSGAAPVAAAGLGAADICTNAGFRMGTAAFTMCVGRVAGDDPLAGLEGALDPEKVAAPQDGEAADLIDDPLAAMEADRVKPGVAPVRPVIRDGEFPQVTGARFPGGDLPGGDLPGGGGLPGGGIPGGGIPGGTPGGGGAPPPPSSGGITTPTAPTAPTPPTLPGWMFGQ